MLVTRSGPLLAETRLDRLRPLGRLGEPAYLAHARIVASLESLGAKDCARYFARPEPDARGETLAWHAGAEGPVRAWSDLSAEERSAAAPRLLAIRDRLAQICAARQAKDPEDGLARLLRIAAVSPGTDHLFLVGEQPVLAAWGFEGSGARFDTLRFAPEPPPMAAPPRAELRPVGQGWAWLAGWWWAPLALLALLALVWLLWSWWPDWSAPGPAGERVAAETRPPQLPAPRAAEPAAPAARAGTEPAPPRTGEVLSIPERGVDFLEGSWRTDSALVDRRDRKPVVQTFTFDRNGWGEVVTRRSDGIECRGRAQARRTPEGGLVIHGVELAVCSDGNAFVPFRLECGRGADRVSDCRGVNKDDGSTYDVVVRRL
jgi:hypothetical protein